MAMFLAKDKTTQKEARTLFEQAVAAQQQMLSSNPQNSLSRRYLGNHLLALCGLCLEQGDHVTAVLRAFDLAQHDSKVSGAQVTAASFISRGISLVLRDETTQEAERAEIAELYARQALELLSQGLALGSNQMDKVKADPAFAPLLKRPDFQGLTQPK
jgi:hypothetical protein